MVDREVNCIENEKMDSLKNKNPDDETSIFHQNLLRSLNADGSLQSLRRSFP